MRVGFVGLGKLGLPVALAMAMKGHDVIGYDVDPAKMQKERFPHREVGPNGEPSIEPLLRQSTLTFGTPSDVVRHAEIIFVAVQTPHDPRYEGVTRLPRERSDFDYRYLKEAAGTVAAIAGEHGVRKTIAVVSTVLPGTIRREILPLVGDRIRLCYNPLFIAMGTVMPDFLDPEFVLLGSDNGGADEVRSFYATITGRPVYRTGIENAEVIKTAYNTYISMKIGFANTLMELCHRMPGCDVDAVTGALALAEARLHSPRYLRGGMADGGGCHPRDNIALSWLARTVGLSYDWFGQVMQGREDQTAWLADVVDAHHRRRGFAHRRVGIYGKAFKAGTNVVAGSPAVLLANLLAERGYAVSMYDPHVDAGPCPFDLAGVYVVATNHREFADPAWRFPPGSVVIDPWRFIADRAGVEVIRLGIGPEVSGPR